MTANFNILFEAPTENIALWKKYEQSIKSLARSFNKAHPEYSEHELFCKAMRIMRNKEWWSFKRFGWFRRVFFKWKDIIRLDFGVTENLSGMEEWYCKITHGRIQRGPNRSCDVFIPDGVAYEDAMAYILPDVIAGDRDYMDALVKQADGSEA